MLIRFGGGKKGIKEYLEQGRKQGRRESREELDERLIIAGNLELTDQIIKSMKGRGDKYLHITLSFKEDELDRDVLKTITREFEQFAFAAYKPEEYSFYAEAHLPRIKSSVNRSTQSTVQRKPHIHIVIPKLNLLSDGYLNPFGVVKKTCTFIDAFQESVNVQFSLASPKENMRLATTGKAEVLSRSKGDHFEPSARQLKAEIASRVMLQRIETWDSFTQLVAEYGDVITRNAGTEHEYLNVKPYAAAKGSNLRDSVFRRSFIELPTETKQSRLGNKVLGKPSHIHEKLNGEAIAAVLDEWQQTRAREVKYINSGNKAKYKAYQDAPFTQKQDILAECESRFYVKHAVRQKLAEETLECEATTPMQLPSRVQNQTTSPVQPDNPIAQLLHDQNEITLQQSATNSVDFLMIKRKLPARKLLDSLVQSHGIQSDTYLIEKGIDGGDRIVCGTRKLNVSDFLTKEMHLNWATAAALLQQVWTLHKPKIEVEKQPEIKDVYPKLCSFAPMNHNSPSSLSSDIPLRTQHAIKEMFDLLFAIDHYPETTCTPKAYELGMRLVPREHANGDVSWQNGNKQVLRDAVSIIYVLDEDDEVVELGLRLAIQKFGPKLEVNGSQEFKNSVVEVACKTNMDVVFADVEMQDYQRRLRNSLLKKEIVDREPVLEVPAVEQRQRDNKGWER